MLVIQCKLGGEKRILKQAQRGKEGCSKRGSIASREASLSPALNAALSFALIDLTSLLAARLRNRKRHIRLGQINSVTSGRNLLARGENFGGQKERGE